MISLRGNRVREDLIHLTHIHRRVRTTRVRAAMLPLNRLLPGGEGMEELRFKILAQAFA